MILLIVLGSLFVIIQGAIILYRRSRPPTVSPYSLVALRRRHERDMMMMAGRPVIHDVYITPLVQDGCVKVDWEAAMVCYSEYCFLPFKQSITHWLVYTACKCDALCRASTDRGHQ